MKILAKVFVLFATSGSSLSYILFVWALWYLYFRQSRNKNIERCNECKSCCDCNCCLTCCSISWWAKCFCCTGDTDEDDDYILPLDPFNDDGIDYRSNNIATIYHTMKRKAITQLNNNDNDTSTLLQGERLCHWVTWFIIGLLLLLILTLVFFPIYYKDKKDLHVEKFALFSYCYSEFCTLMSCFIFSKLMYTIQRKCEELEVYVYQVNEEYKPIQIKIEPSTFTINERNLEPNTFKIIETTNQQQTNTFSIEITDNKLQIKSNTSDTATLKFEMQPNTFTFNETSDSIQLERTTFKIIETTNSQMQQPNTFTLETTDNKLQIKPNTFTIKKKL